LQGEYEYEYEYEYEQEQEKISIPRRRSRVPILGVVAARIFILNKTE
jgi:hypothetical protein